MSTNGFSKKAILQTRKTLLRGSMKPAKAMSRSFTTVDGRVLLDIDNFSSHLIQSITRKKKRNASKLLRKRYGIGVVEWRLIAGLAKEPGIPASQLSKFTLTDKGLVSKALTSLEKKGLIEPIPKNNGSPRVNYQLTEKGDEIHDDFLPVLLEREAAIFADSDEAEIELFFVMLKRISRNLDRFHAEKS